MASVDHAHAPATGCAPSREEDTSEHTNTTLIEGPAEEGPIVPVVSQSSSRRAVPKSGNTELECKSALVVAENTHDTACDPAIVFLLLIPLLSASKPLGFRWATGGETPDFSKYLVMAVGSFIFGSLLLTALVAMGQARPLFNSEYRWVLYHAFFMGIKMVLELGSLVFISPTLFTVVHKASIMSTVIVDTIVKRKLDMARGQLLVVCATTAAVTTYSASSLDSVSGDVNEMIIGVSMVVASGCFGALAMTVLEVFSKFPGQARRMASGPIAERLRALFVTELGKLFVYHGSFFLLDSEFFAEQIFAGWDIVVVIGLMGPLLLISGLEPLIVMRFGSMARKLMQTYDMPLAYFAEALWFNGSLEVPNVSLLATICISISSYFVIRMDEIKISNEAVISTATTIMMVGRDPREDFEAADDVPISEEGEWSEAHSSFNGDDDKDKIPEDLTVVPV